MSLKHEVDISLWFLVIRLCMHRYTMFLPLLCLFLDTFDTARATKLLIHPRETVRFDDRSDIDNGWTPKPTVPPQPPEFYPWLGAPAQRNLEVRKEVDVNKCGWLSGDPNMPLECGKDVCAYYNQYEPKGFVCCPTAASGAKEAGYCPYRSTCLHNRERGNSHFGVGTVESGGVLSWWVPHAVDRVQEVG